MWSTPISPLARAAAENAAGQATPTHAARAFAEPQVKYPNAHFVKVDTDLPPNKPLMAAHAVLSFPTFCFFAPGGKPVWQHLSAAPRMRRAGAAAPALAPLSAAAPAAVRIL